MKMRKILAVLLAVTVLAAASVCAGAETADISSRIKGEILDGAYVLTVQVSGEGEWRADEMAQDSTVVKLASAAEENGVFTARYEPAGDGQVTVGLHHYNRFNVCDELHTFDLLVKDGKVQETTGGSYTAAPDEGEVNPYFSGEWLEKDTQFTVLDVNKSIDSGWNVVITSPVSRGAWVIRGTVHYDCDNSAFVYSDGVKYDLIPGEETQEKEAATGLWGKLSLTGTEDDLVIEWYDMANMEGTAVTFERAPALPAYAYTGDDPIEGAVANILARDERAERFLTEKGCVTIPCPIIHKTEMKDDTHAKVYGTFWIMNYVKRGATLENISGGEYAGIIELEKIGDEWTLVSFEDASEDYEEDIERFTKGNKALREQYLSGSDLDTDENREIRIRFVRDYAEANHLAVTAYKDYGWDPVPLK